MKRMRTAEEVRKDLNYKVFSKSERIPVIVTIFYSDTTVDLGLQFWTTLDLLNGFVINADKTVSRFIERY